MENTYYFLPGGALLSLSALSVNREGTIFVWSLLWGRGFNGKTPPPHIYPAVLRINASQRILVNLLGSGLNLDLQPNVFQE